MCCNLEPPSVIEWGLYDICLYFKPPSVIEWGVWSIVYIDFLIFRPLAPERLLVRVFGFMFLIFVFIAAPEWVLCIFLVSLQVCFKPSCILSGGMFVLP